MKKRGYEIFEFKFKDIFSKEVISIYARTQDTAEVILDYYNECNDARYERKVFGFKKKVFVDIEPETYELQQKDTAEQELIFRKQRSKRR